MANKKDVSKARNLIDQGRKTLCDAWELLPDGKERKGLTEAIQAIDRAIALRQ